MLTMILEKKQTKFVKTLFCKNDTVILILLQNRVNLINVWLESVSCFTLKQPQWVISCLFLLKHDKSSKKKTTQKNWWS